MKKILFLILISLVAFASCKKEDVKNASAQSSKTIDAISNWRTIESWVSSGNGYEGSISDSTISSDIASNGLVLVYAKSNTTNELLPVQIGKTNFYYQVENGSVQIIANDAAPDKTLQFSYVILTKDQLDTLEQKGISSLQLMKMNYQQIRELKN